MAKKAATKREGGVVQEHGGVLFPFKKGVSGNPKGGPRKIALRLKTEGYHPHQISLSIKKILMLNRDELKAFSKHKKITVLEAILVKKVLDGIGKGNLDLFDYILPKTQTIETISTVKVKLSEKEVQEELKELGLPEDILTNR